jgi:hypothetical protein
MGLTADQEQIIIGTLLGNSQIEVGADGPCLVMRSRDISWLASKAEALADIQDSMWQQGANYYWRSKADVRLEPFVQLCYSGSIKAATMNCLNRLRNVAVMVWYGDVGCLVGRNRRNACLRTQHLGSSATIVEQFFNEVSAPCSLNYVRGKPVVVFSHEGTLTLMKIIGQILPTNRYHLVPPV